MESYRQKIPGFTLVELMIAVAVIAVILVIGVPGIVNLKRSGDLTTTSKELAVALNYARAEAVRQGLNIAVVNGDDPIGDPTNTDYGSEGWQIRLVNNDGSMGSLTRSFDKPPAGTGVALTIGAAPITFAALGNVTAASCFDISVTGSSLLRSVDISPSGRVTTCTTSCASRYVVTDPDYDPTKCD